MKTVSDALLPIVRITPNKADTTLTETQDGSVIVRWLRGDTQTRNEVFTGSYVVVNSQSFVLVNTEHSRMNLDGIIIAVRDRPPLEEVGTLAGSVVSWQVAPYCRLAFSILKALYLFGFYTREEYNATVRYMEREAEKAKEEDERRQARREVLQQLQQTVLSPNDLKDILVAHTGRRVSFGKQL
jgi:hypothetical protein